LKTSTPRAGSQTRPPFRIPTMGVLSGVLRGPAVDGDDVTAVSPDVVRARGGENGDASLGNFGKDAC